MECNEKNNEPKQTTQTRILAKQTIKKNNNRSNTNKPDKKHRVCHKNLLILFFGSEEENFRTRVLKMIKK